MGEQPASLVWALRSLTAMIVLGLVTTVLTVVLRDDLIRTWAEGRRELRRVLRTQGLEAIKDGAVQPPAFIPVALVLFVVIAAMIWVLAAFLRGGYGWARVVLTLVLFFIAVGTVSGLRAGIPPVFIVLSSLSFPLGATSIFFLWHKDTGAYLRG